MSALRTDVAPDIGRAGRDRDELLVVKRNVVRGDEGEIGRVELELAGYDVAADGALIARR